MWKYNKPFALCDYYVLIKIGAGEKVTKPKDNRSDRGENNKGGI
jgi:hypothetical protein